MYIDLLLPFFILYPISCWIFNPLVLQGLVNPAVKLLQILVPLWQVQPGRFVSGLPGPSILGVDEYYPLLPKTGRLRGTKSMRFIKHPKYPNNLQISDSQVGFLVRENMESTVTQPSVLLSATALTVNSAPWHIVWHWHVQLQTAETWLTSNYIQPTKHKILYLAIIAVILETSPNRWVVQPFEGSMFHFCYFMGNKQMTVAAFHFTCVFWDFANQVWPPNSWHINCNITTMHLLCSQNWVREGEM